MAMNQEKVQQMLEDIYEDLDRHLTNRYTRHTMGWICDRIAWLWKFRYITDGELKELTDRACEALKVSART